MMETIHIVLAALGFVNTWFVVKMVGEEAVVVCFVEISGDQFFQFVKHTFHCHTKDRSCTVFFSVVWQIMLWRSGEKKPKS